MIGFTPLPSLLGGALIGVAASLLLLFTGRTAGVSGIAGGMLDGRRGDWRWRVEFLGGLVAGGLLLTWFSPGALAAPARGLVGLGLAGLLVGVGTRLGGGCTSGHGICGLGRLSGRSLVAVLVFMLTAGLTVGFVPAGATP